MRCEGLRRTFRPAAAISVCAALSLLQGCGDGGDSAGTGSAALATRWTEISIDASGLDHAPANVGAPHVQGHQPGPCRASRALAIVHIAMFDALNAIEPRYQRYTSVANAQFGASPRAAIAQAAHDTLAALFPSQSAIFAARLAEDLNALPEGPSKTRGVAAGSAAAAAILAMRAADGSAHPEPVIGTGFFCSDQPGKWRADPIAGQPVAMGADWWQVQPFALNTVDQYRCPPPPSMTSAEYAAAFDEVKALGGDGVITPTSRTPDQTIAGIYWAYDGTPSLCAPPRLYNQIAIQIAAQFGSNLHETLRLLTLLNVGMADAGSAIWESKYHYQVWRPVTGVRESDVGTGPTGLGDENPATVGDPTFTPLGAPASNSTGVDFTPPFPAYPSGHAGFGGVLFETLRLFYGTDDVTFTFVSEEYDGVTIDNVGNPRPLLPRTFTSFSQAEEENGQSRIYLGIHWSFDKTAGIELGRNVAQYVWNQRFAPLN